MTGVSTSVGRATGALIALTLAAAAACAHPGAAPRHCTREDVHSASRTPPGGIGARDAGPAANAIAAEATRWLPPSPSMAAAPPDAESRLAPRGFVLPGVLGTLIERLSMVPHVRVLRDWDSSKLTVFFGVHRRGRPGARIEQQDPRDDPREDSYSPSLASLGGHH